MCRNGEIQWNKGKIRIRLSENDDEQKQSRIM